MTLQTVKIFRGWVLALSCLTFGCGGSTHEVAPDASVTIPDGATDAADGSTEVPEASVGMPGDCDAAAFYDPYDVAESATPTNLVACFSGSNALAVRVDLVGSPVTGRLDEPCVPGLPRQGECRDRCRSEADCGPGALCTGVQYVYRTDNRVLAASRHGNECLEAQCTSPADCGGRACGVSRYSCGGVHGFYCRTEEDECRSDDDCGGFLVGHCSYIKGRFRCEQWPSSCN